MKLNILLLTASMAISSAVFSQKKKEKPPLDGKTFIVQSTEVKATGKPSKAVEDEVVFKSNQVKSPLIKEKTQISAIPYEITVDSTYTDEDGEDGRIIEFMAESVSDNGETLKWTGKVTNYEIEGNILWTGKNGKKKKEYNFSGSDKKKK